MTPYITLDNMVTLSSASPRTSSLSRADIWIEFDSLHEPIDQQLKRRQEILNDNGPVLGWSSPPLHGSDGRSWLLAGEHSDATGLARTQIFWHERQQTFHRRCQLLVHFPPVRNFEVPQSKNTFISAISASCISYQDGGDERGEWPPYEWRAHSSIV
jgi:hypothetical protein